MDVEHRRVVLTASVTLMLQCRLCEGAECSPKCPVKISANLVFGMEDRGLDRAATTKDSKKAKKSQIVKEWKRLYGQGTSGHSAAGQGRCATSVMGGRLHK